MRPPTTCPRRITRITDAEPLAFKGILHIGDEDIAVLVRKITPQDPIKPASHIARLFSNQRIRTNVPLTTQPWVGDRCNYDAYCHLGLACTLQVVDLFYL